MESFSTSRKVAKQNMFVQLTSRREWQSFAVTVCTVTVQSVFWVNTLISATVLQLLYKSILWPKKKALSNKGKRQSMIALRAWMYCISKCSRKKTSNAIMRRAVRGKEDKELPLLQRISLLEVPASEKKLIYSTSDKSPHTVNAFSEFKQQTNFDIHCSGKKSLFCKNNKKKRLAWPKKTQGINNRSVQHWPCLIGPNLRFLVLTAMSLLDILRVNRWFMKMWRTL